MDERTKYIIEETLAALAFVALLLLILVAPAFCEETNDIGVKTGGYVTPMNESLRGPIDTYDTVKSQIQDTAKTVQVGVSDAALQALQPVPNVPAEAPKQKPPGFWKRFHPDNIETYHPRLNKFWNGYMFIYEHGMKQTLDIAAKSAQCVTPFVIN